ncbi:DUF5017 domain-containing protein [Puteibacter caeruleilacunae]|nr:DUF5017 domain-containing protein [Puteibacter caeruleilacunae]
MHINKMIIVMLTAVFLWSCSDEEAVMPNVLIKADNTTVSVGDTVTFSFNGYADHVVFYSGEFGHNYSSIDSIFVDASLQMSFTSQGLWGLNGDRMSMYYSTIFSSFDDLDNLVENTDDAREPHEKIKELWEQAEWTKVEDVTFGNSDIWTTESMQLDFIKAPSVNFAFVFENNSNWGNYRIKDLSIQAISDKLPAPVDLGGFTNGYRSVAVVQPSEAQIPEWRNWQTGIQLFHGGQPARVGPLETWCVLAPINTEKTKFNIPTDKGQVVKSYLHDDLNTFKAVYNEPGTHTATFVITNGSTTGDEFASQLIDIEITVTE